ncbi:MAG: hypothetical protein KDE14_06565 [Rhodobacteraceae bacterium]|nr:hypothetical protein [Paracoccaceae bacterium]
MTQQKYTGRGRYAFHDKPPDGTGSEAYFTEFHVFYLAVGIKLLDAGFKQEEIVWYLRAARLSFEREYNRLERLGFPANDLVWEADTLGKDVAKRIDGYDDPTVFAVIFMVQLKELWSLAQWRKKDPIIIAPRFAYGFDNLRQPLANELPSGAFGCHLIEISMLAKKVSLAVQNAPVVRRGRPSAA